MLMDTGAGHPIALESYHNSSFPLPEKFMIANLGVGLSGNIGGFIGRVKNFRIGKFDVKNPITAFPLYDDVAAKILTIPRDGSIGNQLLKKFEIIFDYENSCIYLKPNSFFSQEMEHDMSGMELVSRGDEFNRYFINRVEPGSPADEFGVLKDDELLNVNFKAVSKMTFDEINDLFKSKDGRNLYLEIRRENEVYRGVITLKRRI